MISSISFIPRGAARTRPVRFEIGEEEYKRIQELASIELADKKEVEGEEYEEEGHAEEEEGGILGAPTRMNDDEEEFIMMEQGNMAIAMDRDSDDEDAEDDEILPTDTLIVVALTEDEFSHLEVQLMTESGDLYVHHDITLPEFPLCLAWLDCPPYLTSDGTQQAVGNYMAVGTFEPGIEIWNLDVMDPLEPTAVLGGYAGDPTKKKKKNPTFKPGSHIDGVLGLSWNQVYRVALASASGDNTVKIWDVTTQKCSGTFTHHSDKVQSVQWHHQQAWLLASGGFDKMVALIDCRTGSVSGSYQLGADIESMVWDPFSSYNLYAAVENGQIVCMDIRNTASPLSSFQAHEKTVSAIAFSHKIPGMMASASVDKTVRVWDTHNSVDGEMPRLVAYKTMAVGKLFTLQFNSDDPYLLATAGDKGMLAIWESSELEVIKTTFESRVLTDTSAFFNDQEAVFEIGTMNKSVEVAGKEDDDGWMDTSAQVENQETKKKKKSKKSKA